ncbi:hypothetical protein [Deinococcus maricopensis]|uniref:Uncharacterized protein n=1 Tax=Deinococcus maricopensis (strain DSM 21211 / LMG 22137 / NRRL B-23946 / LB-34) TaxID=709986 RepID=E8U523_DEIML|nr:hypothetical protein [Deinococcus maricopensis]ADV66162.1 hypothetical protein Deima_0503 [Deinococcus maricopensis DSM 21211]
MRLLPVALLLSSALAAAALLTRAGWQAQAGVPRVTGYGAHGDGQLIGGADGAGRFRLALERRTRAGTHIAWGARGLGEAARAHVLRVPGYMPRDIVVQTCRAEACAVVGLGAHTGQEVWREPGRVARQAGVAVYIVGEGRTVRRNLLTGERSEQ